MIIFSSWGANSPHLLVSPDSPSWYFMFLCRSSYEEKYIIGFIIIGVEGVVG